jgi:hypothetical protein
MTVFILYCINVIDAIKCGYRSRLTGQLLVADRRHMNSTSEGRLIHGAFFTCSPFIKVSWVNWIVVLIPSTDYTYPQGSIVDFPEMNINLEDRYTNFYRSNSSASDLLASERKHCRATHEQISSGPHDLYQRWMELYQSLPDDIRTLPEDCALAGMNEIARLNTLTDLIEASILHC